MDTVTQSLEAPAAPLPAGEPVEAVVPESPREPEPVDLLPWLPCTLIVEVPVVNFTVASLLALRPGKLVETAWHQSTDVPLRINGLLMAWTEFEVVGDRLAARITDLL